MYLFHLTRHFFKGLSESDHQCLCAWGRAHRSHPAYHGICFHFQVVVADNGSGMSPEVAKHLFDRYYRGTNTEQKPEGTGLGPAIAKGIVELHGGRIIVASVPGAGTTFQIDFPFR